MRSMIVALVFAGCTHSEPPVTPASASARTCPLGIDGGSVKVDDTEDGVMLAFTGPNVAEVRERVFDASATYGTGKGFGKGHEGHHGDGGRHGLQAQQLPPMRAASAEIEGGARLRLTPVDVGDLQVLRTKVRARVLAMNGPCRR